MIASTLSLLGGQPRRAAGGEKPLRLGAGGRRSLGFLEVMKLPR